MKQGWLILLFFCAMAAAMVPRMRRSQPATSTEAAPRICAPTTPCGWSFYESVDKTIEMNITNNYCICSADTICDVYEDDSLTNLLVFRCMKPGS